MRVALLAYACGRFSDPRLEFGPRWVSHHSKLFNPEDIYVVCNHVDEEIYSNVNTFHRDHPEGNVYDVYWEMATSYEILTRLRSTYNTIFFSLLDEFLCTRKSVEDLARNGDEWVPCQRIPTYDVIHDVFNEPAINMSRPTLPQRSFWKYAPGSTHPSILNSGLAPALGWHSLAGVEPTDIPFAYGALWAHMKREDFDSLHRRTNDRQTWKWGIAKDTKGLSHQNKLTDDALTEWFFQDLVDLEPVQTDFLEVP